MSLYGNTKGTEMEDLVEKYIKLETQGTVFYCGLARLAGEQGMDKVASTLVNLALDEACHAGLYSVLNGHPPQDLQAVFSRLAKAETGAKERIGVLAQQARDLGLHQAAAAMDAAAEDEVRHGKQLEVLLEMLKTANCQ